MSALANGQQLDPPRHADEAAVPPVPGDLAADDLRDLMQTVSETSRQLQRTHVILQKEVARLQRELADANEQLRRSKSLAALGGMAAGIAHEIRNPLGSIQLYVQMLEEDVADDPGQAALCRKIDRAVCSLDAIVRDVLVFARETRLAARPTSARTLIERALDGCASLIERGGIDVEQDADDEIELCADETLLGQALSNVIRNAAEAMMEWDEGGGRRSLRLRVGRREVRCPEGGRSPRIVIGVEDTGPGIPDGVIDRMFNPFFTTRATGTGLGLAIVHRIVDAHGGHINVNRLEPHGTRIELCLRERTPHQDGSGDTDDGAGDNGQLPDFEIFTTTTPSG